MSEITLLPGIQQQRLHLSGLCRNPAGVHLVEEMLNTSKITKYYFAWVCENPNAMHIIQRVDESWINWSHLSKNPSARELLELNPEKIDWLYLNDNHCEWAVRLLASNPDKIDWKLLSANPYAIDLLKENQDKIHWSKLCLNPRAGEILDFTNADMIEKHADWKSLSANAELFYQFRDYFRDHNDESPDQWKIFLDWKGLSANTHPEALEYLEKNKSRIDWGILSQNPAIFVNTLPVLR